MDIELVQFLNPTRIHDELVNGCKSGDGYYISLEIFGRNDEFRDIHIFTPDGITIAIIPYHNVAMCVPK